MIRIAEMAARDGLQNEAAHVPAGVKVAFIDALSLTGVQEIEAGAFVAPRMIPQLQDAEEVFAGIRRAPGVTYSALVPNERGLDRALRSRVDKIAVFTAASETFNRHNINATISESIDRFAPVVRRARGAGLPIRGYISTAFWCPYEGSVPPDKTIEVTQRLLDLGVDEISIGDTIGKAVPSEVLRLLDLLLPLVASKRLAMHFHDTYQHAVENVIASRSRGITHFDSSAGGIGGCPYAPGASGNVSTEAVVLALRQRGDEVGVDLEAVRKAGNVIAAALGRPFPP
jgi:hydroxymethylglutaryl-CoA lyase